MTNDALPLRVLDPYLAFNQLCQEPMPTAAHVVTNRLIKQTSTNQPIHCHI